MMLKPPDGVAQLLKPPSDPLAAVLAKVDQAWAFNAFELDEVRFCLEWVALCVWGLVWEGEGTWVQGGRGQV